MPSLEQLSYPIDFDAAYEDARQASLVVVERDVDFQSAHADLGGLRRNHIAVDDPSVYVPFANIAREDDKKQEILRGLGGLGLLAVSSADFKAMNHPTRQDYAAALRDYRNALDSRAKVLATEGSIDGHYFQKRYPGTDQEWATKYSAELVALQGTLVGTSLFEVAAAAAQPARRRTPVTKDWVLHTTRARKFVVHKPSSRPRIAA